MAASGMRVVNSHDLIIGAVSSLLTKTIAYRMQDATFLFLKNKVRPMSRDFETQ